MVDAVLGDRLADAPFATDPIFGLRRPRSIPGVPETILDPRAAWPDPDAYDRRARDLAGRFHANFERFESVDPAIRDAGPRAE